MMIPPRKRVTHKDVAKLAGVSPAVVSYVVNNGPRPTSAEVRARVLNAIQELDYHPNAFARSLRARQTNTIGFIVNDYYALSVFLASYTAAILTGLTVGLKAHGYYILVYPMTPDEEMKNVETLLRSGRLDGVVVRLVQAPPVTDALLDVIAATNIPCVCLEQPAAARFGFSSVSYDDRHGAYEATSYLLAKGHRRIAHISGDPRYETARARLDGYHQALAAYGLSRDPALVVGGTWNRDEVGPAVARLMSYPDPPTAILAASDSIAFAAIDELRRRHYRVPEDIAIIGVDDIELARQMAPPLTTVRIPLQQMGQRASELILDMIDAHEGAAAQAEILPVELIRRDSA